MAPGPTTGSGSPGGTTSGLLAVLEAGRLELSGDLVTVPGPDGALRGGVFGAVTPGQAAAVVGELLVRADPGPVAQDLPWAGCARRTDGSLVATCSTMLLSGLFWSLESGPRGPRVVVGTDPLSVARARCGPTRPDRDFLRDLLRGGTSAAGTPYTGVHRVWPGDTLRVDPRTRTVGQETWCGPGTLPEPSLAGESVVLRYLDAFDQVVGGLVERAGPLVATVSGGLDSTFVAAGLARARPGGPVHGFCHRPLARAEPKAIGGFDPDDYPLAVSMAAHYPDVITVDPLSNDALVHPLDAARAAYQASGWPEFGVANSVWLNAALDRARTLGARFCFTGQYGNATFSGDHPYAPEFYARQLRLGSALREALRGQHRKATAHHLLHRLRPPRDDFRRVWTVFGLRDPVRTYSAPDRAQYLQLLTGRNTGSGATIGPARAPGVLFADPFSSRSLLELAAAIEPAQWRRGGYRGFARRLGEGRVPDGIRLRVRRGGQFSDVWYVARQDPRRLAGDVEYVLAHELSADLFDPDVTRAWLAGLLDTPATAATPDGFVTMLPVIAGLQFADWLGGTLRPAG